MADISHIKTVLRVCGLIMIWSNAVSSTCLLLVALHGLQLKIKRELHSPCLELSSNCSQERPFKLQYGDKCPYNVR